MMTFTKFLCFKKDTRNYINTLTVAGCLLLAFCTFKKILIPATHSVYPLVLYRTGETATLKDQYVLFALKDSYLPKGEAFLVKRLGCMEGERISQQGNDTYCNGKLIARAMTHDSKGTPLKKFTFSGVVPTGKAFAVGDTVNSYDSRYWGFIDISTTERLVPVF